LAPKSDDSAKTSPSTPLHPTPLIAGEVMETGQTELMARGSGRLAKLAIAATVGLVALGGAIWTYGGGGEGTKAEVVSVSSAVSTPTEPVATAPIASPAPTKEVPSAMEVPPADTDAGKRAKPKKKRRKKKAKPQAAKSAPVAKAPAAAPAPKPKAEPSKKSKMSKAKALYTKATKQFAKGQYNEAIGLFREALVAGYREPDIYYQLGRTYMRLSKPEQARRHFQTYLKKYPKTPKRKLVEAILKRGK
jgi:hypothetical protein